MEGKIQGPLERSPHGQGFAVDLAANDDRHPVVLMHPTRWVRSAASSVGPYPLVSYHDRVEWQQHTFVEVMEHLYRRDRRLAAYVAQQARKPVPAPTVDNEGDQGE